MGFSTKAFLSQNQWSLGTKIARRALQGVVERSPGTGSLLLWVKHIDVPPNADAPPAPAWTDGETIFYHEKMFADLPLKQQMGVVVHELLHISLGHMGRIKNIRKRDHNFNMRLANIAADAIINDVIVASGNNWLQLPDGAIYLTDLLKTIGEQARREEALGYWTLELLYERLKEKMPENSGGQGNLDNNNNDNNNNNNTSGSSNNGQGPAPVHIGANSFPGFFQDIHEEDVVNSDDSTEKEQLWKAWMNRAKAGDGTRGILRGRIADADADSKINWQQILKSKINRYVLPKLRETWARPARRWIAITQAGYDIPFEPGTEYLRTGKFALVIDTSASVPCDLFRRFMAEIKLIQKQTNAIMHVLVADMAIHKEQTIYPTNSNFEIQFRGGGGTNFTPALRRCDELKVNAIVYFTDLEGPAFYRPKVPVIWAVPKQANKPVPNAPFGSVVLLE